MSNAITGLSTKEAYDLSKLAYLNLHQIADEIGIFTNGSYEGMTIHEISQTIINHYIINPSDEKIPYNGGLAHSDFITLLTELSQSDNRLGDLRLKEYEYDNVTDDDSFTGFVGMAFEDNENNTYFAFTGTEGTSETIKEEALGTFLSQDWLDNFQLLSEASEQFQQIEDFVTRNKTDGETYVTGHSKGAANAMYAVAAVDGVTGIAFDGPGISHLLTEEQKERLKNSGSITYIAKGDMVGSLLYHDEQRIFVDTHDTFTCIAKDGDTAPTEKNYSGVTGIFDYHWLQALRFDEDGELVSAERTLASENIEYLTRVMYHYNQQNKNLSGITNLVEELAQDSDKFALDLVKELSPTVMAGIIFNYLPGVTKMIAGGILLYDVITDMANTFAGMEEDVSRNIEGSNFSDSLNYGSRAGGVNIYGKDGNDNIYGSQSGNNALYGDVGDDKIYSYGGDDYLFGGVGNDILSAGAGNDYLSSGVGNDTLDGGVGDDKYIFNKDFGNDTITDYRNTADSSGFNDELIFLDHDSTDFTQAVEGYDLVLRTKDGGHSVRLKNYFSNANYMVEKFSFRDKELLLSDFLKNIGGTEQADTFNMGQLDQDARAYGYDGNDYMQMGSGNDYLNGGIGNDTLIGGYGSDTYHFEKGWGEDTLTDTFSREGDVDTISFGAGISFDDLVFTQSGADLLIQNGSDIIRVSNYFSGAYGVERLLFADGTSLMLEDITDITNGTELADSINKSSKKNRQLIYGNGGNDSLYGGSAKDEIYGGIGNDGLFGNAGNDYLNGGDGEDSLYGAAGDDSLLGEFGVDNLLGDIGNDLLDGGDGNDILQGGEGNDHLLGGNGNDTLYGNLAQPPKGTMPIEKAGDDYLDGGEGDDILYGGIGTDTFKASSGKDSFNDFSFTSGNMDNIDLGDYNFSDYEWSGKGYNLIGRNKLNGSEFTATNGLNYKLSGNSKIFGKDGTHNFHETLNRIKGTDGNDSISSSSDRDSTMDGGGGNDTLYGGSGNDSLYGGSGSDILSGNTGNDHLHGGDGDDSLIDGGTGDDILYGDNGADTLSGNNGSDTLDGGNDNDFLEGGDGNDILRGGSGNDTLYGYRNPPAKGTLPIETASDDYLDGGDGDDVLYGGSGNDTFKLSSGNDKFADFSASTGNMDSIDLGNNAFSNFDWSGNNRDLVGKNKSTGATFTVTNGLSLNGESAKIYSNGIAYGYQEALKEMHGGDTNDWIDMIASTKSVTMYGGDGDDRLYGTNYSDALYGEEGNDAIYGNAGDDSMYGGSGMDTLIGSSGNDLLFGGEDNDFYWYKAGDGHDTIQDSSGNDTLVIENFQRSNVVFKVLGGDLNIYFMASGNTVKRDDMITIKGYAGTNTRIENFRFYYHLGNVSYDRTYKYDEVLQEIEKDRGVAITFEPVQQASVMMNASVSTESSGIFATQDINTGVNQLIETMSSFGVEDNFSSETISNAFKQDDQNVPLWTLDAAV